MSSWRSYLERWRRNERQLLRIVIPCGLMVVAAGLVDSPTFGATIAGLLATVSLAMALMRSDGSANPTLPVELETPLLIARDQELFERYRRIASLLLKVTQHHDPLYREIALEQIDELNARLTSIAAGTLVFEGTETWRIVYERLLRSPGLFLYRSVAWIKSPKYWQDEPGRKSMIVNFELHEREKLTIERIAIIADDVWRAGARWPVEPVHTWLRQHVNRGIPIRVVRQSALVNEPDLIADIGIYGSRALGTQILNDDCSTCRFVLSFDYPRVAEAETRWVRLEVYAESYGVHLDRILPSD